MFGRLTWKIRWFLINRRLGVLLRKARLRLRVLTLQQQV